MQFLTVPRESYVYDANRDQLVEPEAEKLFARLRADQPVVVTQEIPQDVPGADTGSGGPDGPAPAPTFRGNTAAEQTCE